MTSSLTRIAPKGDSFYVLSPHPPCLILLGTQQAEKAMSQRIQLETDYFALSENLPYPVWAIRLDDDLIYLNPAGRSFLEVGKKGMDIARWAEIIHPDDVAEILGRWARIVDSPDPFSWDYRIRIGSGGYRWVRSTGRPLTDASGEVYLYVGSLTDIHELKDRTANLQALFEAVPIGIVVRDYSAVKRYVDELQAHISPMSLRDYLAGHPEEIAIVAGMVRPVSANGTAVRFSAEMDGPRTSLGIREITVGPSNKEVLIQVLGSIRDGRLDLHDEYQCQTSDGTVRHLATRWLDDPSTEVPFERVITSFVDVTQEKEVLRELQERVAELRETQADAKITSVRLDLTTGVMSLGPGFLQTIGLNGSEGADEQDRLDKVHPDDAHSLVSLRDRAIEANEAFAITFRALRDDGGWTWLHARARPEIVNGAPVALKGTCQDVTELIQTSNALDANRDLLHQIMDNSPAVIYMKDLEGRFLYVNRSFESWAGKPGSDIIGKSDGDFQGPEVVAAVRENDQYVVQTRQSIQREERVIENGEAHTYASVKFPMFDGDGNITGVCGISTDITDRVLAENARRDERERIAAEIHDDAVQVMASVALRLETLASKTDDAFFRDRLTQMTGGVRASIDSLRGLMFDLRSSTRDAGLVDALGGYVRQIDREHGLKCSFEVDLPSEPSREVIEAMNKIGREALINCVKHAAATRVKLKLSRRGGGTHLVVEDDGIGFDPATSIGGLDHLGLETMSKRAVALGGWCKVDSTLGEGSSVRVWIPDL